MTDINYREAVSEVLEILNFTDEVYVKKIPKSFINFLEQNKSNTYKAHFDYSKSVKELQLKPETEALLGIIYLKYWANKEERKLFEIEIQKNEEKFQKQLREKYNPEKLFNKNM